MKNQIHNVLILEQEAGSCRHIKQVLEEHRFQVDVTTDAENTEKKLNQLRQPVILFVYLPDESFDEWVQKGKELYKQSEALLLFVLDNVDRKRFEAIREYNPYGFVTTQVDPYSLFQTLYFAIMLFEERSSANQLKKDIESELNTLATTFQSTTGTELFDKVCKHLTESLNIDFAFIGELMDGKQRVKVHSFFGEGESQKIFEYDLVDTPCANVAEQDPCHFQSGVQDLFPNDELLQRMDIEGYIGIPLSSSSDKPLGISVLLSKKPIKNVKRCQQYLQIYSERVSAEMERLRAEEELRAREQELRSINEHISEGIYRSTPNDGLVYINEAFASMFGYNDTEELLSLDSPKLYAKEGRRKELAAIEDKESFIKNEEVEFRRKDGSTFWGLMNSKAVYDEDGNVQYYDGSILDITKRKNSEELLKHSLREKDVLLMEIHHRVKNNLAIISGLLELEVMNKESNQEVKNIFRESQLRIQSMAMIHEKLYQAGNFTNLKLENYITELVDVIYDALIKNGKDINVEIENDADVQLNINQAIPCALILNELVTNALKYAFNGTETGRLRIQLESKDDVISLTVEDNGPGLPDDFEERSQNSLGTVLVRQLVKQLHGELNIQNENGACFEVIFRKNDKSGSASSRKIMEHQKIYSVTDS